MTIKFHKSLCPDSIVSEDGRCTITKNRSHAGRTRRNKDRWEVCWTVHIDSVLVRECATRKEAKEYACKRLTAVPSNP